MIHKLLITIVIISAHMLGMAQYNPEIGEKRVLGEKEVYFDSYVGANNDFHYYFVENYDGYVISLHGVSFDGKTQLTYPINKLLPEEIFIQLTDDKVVLFETLSGDDNLKLQRSILSKTLKQSKTETILSHKFKSATHKGGFVLNASIDNEFVAVLQEKPGSLSKSEVLTVHVYNKSGKFEWSSEWDTQLKQTNQPANEINISKSGVVYVLKRHRNGREFFYHTYIFKNGSSPKHIKADISGLRISEVMQVCGHNDELILAGLYSETLYENNDGYFYRIMDESGHFKMKINKSFDEAFMETYIGKKASKKDANIDHVNIQFLKVRNDGFIFSLIADSREIFKDKKGTYYDEKFVTGPARIQHIDYNGDLIEEHKIMNEKTTWNFQHNFAYISCTGIDSTLLCHNDIESDDKTKSAEFPFNSTSFIQIPFNNPEETKTFNITIPGDFQVYPRSVAYSDDAIIGLLMNSELTEIRPFKIVLEK